MSVVGLRLLFIHGRGLKDVCSPLSFYLCRDKNLFDIRASDGDEKPSLNAWRTLEPVVSLRSGMNAQRGTCNEAPHEHFLRILRDLYLYYEITVPVAACDRVKDSDH